MSVTDRGDVVGRLVRPDYLSAAREQHEAGELDEREFESVEDRAVDASIDLQQTPGLDVLTAVWGAGGGSA